MVTTCFFATDPTGVMQERVGLPSIRTVQAPHCPSPQPYLAPIKSNSSRRTLRRLRSGSEEMEWTLPLTLICCFSSIGVSSSYLTLAFWDTGQDGLSFLKGTISNVYPY